jgi:hypothetical protein
VRSVDAANEPTSHSIQKDEEGAFWKEPAAHGTHRKFVALLLSLPGCWLLFPPVPVPDDDGGVFIFDDGGVTDAGADAGAWPLDKVACTWKGKRLYG